MPKYLLEALASFIAASNQDKNQKYTNSQQEQRSINKIMKAADASGQKHNKKFTPVPIIYFKYFRPSIKLI